MSYNSIIEMASNQSLLARVTAAAASLGAESPLEWARANIWHVCSDQIWADAWDFAKGQADNPNVNPDTGARTDVISDQMIEQAVETRMGELSPEPPA